MIGIVQDITERKRKLMSSWTNTAISWRFGVRLDPLTGIANRLALEEALHSEWRRAARNGQAIALLMIDLDRLKAYNDTYGHVQGDAVALSSLRVLPPISGARVKWWPVTAVRSLWCCCQESAWSMRKFV